MKATFRILTHEVVSRIQPADNQSRDRFWRNAHEEHDEDLRAQMAWELGEVIVRGWSVRCRARVMFHVMRDPRLFVVSIPVNSEDRAGRPSHVVIGGSQSCGKTAVVDEYRRVCRAVGWAEEPAAVGEFEAKFSDPKAWTSPSRMYWVLLGSLLILGFAAVYRSCGREKEPDPDGRGRTTLQMQQER